jgi:hypothetical protein
MDMGMDTDMGAIMDMVIMAITEMVAAVFIAIITVEAHLQIEVHTIEDMFLTDLHLLVTVQ